jgi:cysteine-rich repeat protein
VLRLSSSFALLLLVACSAAESSPAPSVSTPLAQCVPNQTLRCLCGLDDGVQTCNEDGTLAPCECSGSKTPPDDKEPSPTPTPSPADAGTRCGNGWVEAGEACDDGNTKDGDGCSASCVPDGAPKSGATCPGQAAHLWKGSSFTLAGTTDTYAHVTNATCWNAIGPERVYALTPHESGVLTIRGSFAPKFDAVVSVRTDCAASPTELMCEDTLSKPFERVLQVEKGQTIHLFVDGDDASAKGAFAIDLELL